MGLPCRGAARFGADRARLRGSWECFSDGRSEQGHLCGEHWGRKGCHAGVQANQLLPDTSMWGLCECQTSSEAMGDPVLSQLPCIFANSAPLVLS